MHDPSNCDRVRFQLAGLIYATQTFGLCNAVDDDFLTLPYDGVLGLGWPSIAQNRVVPPMQNLLPQLDQPIFTLWFDRFVAFRRTSNQACC